MDYLYGQLPEIVYDPADLSGKSPNGTISLNINNDKRELILDVLKTPGKLIIKDPGNVEYSYDGSQDVAVDISKFFNVEIEYKTATEEDIANKIPTANSSVGDGYLQIDVSGKTTYVPMATPMSTSSGVQKITSINTIYDSKNDLPGDASIGDVYPVNQLINTTQRGVVLYEKTASGYESRNAIVKGNIYAIIDSGLLAIAISKTEFKILNGALENAINDLKNNIDNLNTQINDKVNNDIVELKNSIYSIEPIYFYDSDSDDEIIEKFLRISSTGTSNAFYSTNVNGKDVLASLNLKSYVEYSVEFNYNVEHIEGYGFCEVDGKLYKVGIEIIYEPNLPYFINHIQEEVVSDNFNIIEIESIETDSNLSDSAIVFGAHITEEQASKIKENFTTTIIKIKEVDGLTLFPLSDDAGYTYTANVSLLGIFAGVVALVDVEDYTVSAIISVFDLSDIENRQYIQLNNVVE